MNVEITPLHADARHNGSLAFMDAGPAASRLRIYEAPRPATSTDAPTSAMLVEIELTKPAGTVSDGQLTLTQAADGLIVATGVADWARMVTGDGLDAMDLDCSDLAGSAAVKLVTTQLYLGGAARLVSCVLS